MGTIVMKKFLNNLSKLVGDCGNIWDSQMAISASVIIQNMAYHADEWEWNQFRPYLSILKQMSELRPDDHTIQWAYSEAKMEIEAHFMSIEEDLRNEYELNALENQSPEC
jgi:hypothetical protein